MPRYRARVPYIDDQGRERWVPIEVNVATGDPDELAQAAEEEWERLHPGRAGVLPEDLEWQRLEEEE